MPATPSKESAHHGQIQKVCSHRQAMSKGKTKRAGDQSVNLPNGAANDFIARLEQQRENRRLKAIAALQTFTPQERFVAVAVWQGCNDQTICDRLKLHRTTVRGHITSMMTKLGVNTRTGIALAFEISLHNDTGRVSPWSYHPGLKDGKAPKSPRLLERLLPSCVTDEN